MVDPSFGTALPYGSVLGSLQSSPHVAGALVVWFALSCRGPEQAPDRQSATTTVAESQSKAKPKSPIEPQSPAEPKPVDNPPTVKAEGQPTAAEPVATEVAAERSGPCPPGMALVDGGTISKKQRARWKKLYPDADPAPATLEPFCLDLREATEADVSACTAVIQARPDMLPCVARGDCGANPVESLSRREAGQYCASGGKRVPTLTEWLWAAGGGTEDRKYPWGNTPPTAKHVNGCDDACARSRMTDCDDRDFKKGYCTLRNLSSVPGEDGYQDVAPVGSFQAGAGRWGHLDLAGNVSEYVTLRADNDDFVCGGSYEARLPGFDFSLHKEICESAGGSSSVRCASELPSTAPPR